MTGCVHNTSTTHPRRARERATVRDGTDCTQHKSPGAANCIHTGSVTTDKDFDNCAMKNPTSTLL